MHQRVGSHERSPSPTQASCDISEMAEPNCIFIFMMCDKWFRMQSKHSVVPSRALPGGLLHHRGSGQPCQIIKWLSARRHHSQMFIPHEPLGFLLVLTAARLFPDVGLPRCSQTADGLNWYSPDVRPVRGCHNDMDHFSGNTLPLNLKWVSFSFNQWSLMAWVELWWWIVCF